MIVQPDFTGHWKTRLLIEITGDPSAPLALLDLWGYCQTSRRWQFPEMTPAQLSAICRWGSRKPACHVALTKAGFLDRLDPKGFTAHDWDIYNAQLIQKWEAGKKGGRPAKEETDRFPPVNRKETDKTRPDQNGNGLEESRSGALPAAANGGVVDVSQLVGGLVAKCSVRVASAPSLDEVKAEMERQFDGASKYAAEFHRLKTANGWRDQHNQPIKNWKPLARSWASACESRARGVQRRR